MQAAQRSSRIGSRDGRSRRVPRTIGRVAARCTAFVAALSFAVCGAPGAVLASTPNYPQLIALAAANVQSDALPDGAVLFTPTKINPYYANIAMTGLARNRTQLGTIQKWMSWYIAHLNLPDSWGLRGTVYDYAVNGVSETSLQTADSTDSYAATFLTLASAYYDTGDRNAQAYVASIDPQLKLIASVLSATQQPSGMDIARPDYPVQFLMDNTEDYRGALDFAHVSLMLGDRASAVSYATFAGRVARAIAGLRNPVTGMYAPARFADGQAPAANWNTWYPDAVAQLYPVLNGVVGRSSPQAVASYSAFNAAYPNWAAFGFNDPFGWNQLGIVAEIMGDTTRANAYIGNVSTRFVFAGFPWTWYDAEAGWFLESNQLAASAAGKNGKPGATIHHFGR
jgi:hypothetical protein